MSSADPFEVLRQLNPVDATQLPDADTPDGQALLEEILRQPGRRPRRLRLRHVMLGRAGRRYLVPAIAVLALGAGAVGWALTRGVTEPLTVGCYAAADLHAKTVVIPAGARGPIAACQELWKQGELGTGPTPPLEACVLPSGAIGVFPSYQRDTCRALGLPPVPSTHASGGPVVRLKERLVDRFLNEECVGEQEARTVVQAELTRLNLDGWGVERAAPFTTARPCATLAFDIRGRTVVLVPAPR